MSQHLHRVKLYETTTHIYIVGSNASNCRFNLLKIDRSDPFFFAIGEAEQEYSESDIMELLATVSEGNSIMYKSQDEQPSAAVKERKALIERISNAFGLIGAVRFVEGYYVLLVTRAKIVSKLGYHNIYKIDEVAMLYIGPNGAPLDPTEQRYVRLFQSVDLSTDFYFSYSYDLSRTMQENASVCHESSRWTGFRNQMQSSSDQKFVWNTFLLEPLRKSNISERWLIEIVHGYVGRIVIKFPCSKLSITLIGRRSSKYAGTRFLKRGANLSGDVANDVETEQIIWDTLSSPNFDCGKFSAFVQRRGSVPLIWSQDPATRGVVGRPPISVEIYEPHSQTTAAHFRDLRMKYGNPLIVMNLVKRREKRKQEALLHDYFLEAVKYLNFFLPRSEQIAYLSFDVARCNKTGIVVPKLEEIGLRAVLSQGWFQSFPLLTSHIAHMKSIFNHFEPKFHSNGRFLLQSGVSRTNCVDCLDRTNVAQFGIGRVALGFQLYTMGCIGEPTIPPSSPLGVIYEGLIDEFGDVLALQYAGSQLVHSIKHYKKTSAFQERSRDVIQTISRYYSNTFGDYDKQNAINLFLGVYRPGISSDTPLWELNTDYYLHFPIGFKMCSDYCAWFLQPAEEIESFAQTTFLALSDDDCSALDKNRYAECYDGYYRVWELTQFDERDFVQPDRNVYDIQCSPYEELIKIKASSDKINEASSNRKLSKKVKQLKENMIDDEDEEDEPIVKSDAEVQYYCGFEELTSYRVDGYSLPEVTSNEVRSDRLYTGLSSALAVYGVEISMTNEVDVLKCIEYVQHGEYHAANSDLYAEKLKKLSEMRSRKVYECWNIQPLSLFTMDSAFNMEIPEVSRASLKIYSDTVERAINGCFEPSPTDNEIYSKYTNGDH